MREPGEPTFKPESPGDGGEQEIAPEDIQEPSPETVDKEMKQEEEQEMSLEGKEGFTQVTPEELDYLRDFNREEGTTERLAELKRTDEEGYDRHKKIDARRLEEFQSIKLPTLSQEHAEGYSESEKDATGLRARVSSEELRQRLEEISQWNNEWGQLTEQEKLARYSRIQDLLMNQSKVGIPEDSKGVEKYKSEISKIEENQEALIKRLEEDIDRVDERELESLQSYPLAISESEGKEKWELYERNNPTKYKRMRALQEQFQKELELKEAPLVLSDDERIAPSRVSFYPPGLDNMDIPELQDLLKRSEDFQERWTGLSDDEKAEDLKRVLKLQGRTEEGLGLHGRAVREGETPIEAGARYLTGGMEDQIKSLERVISEKEAEKLAEAESTVEESYPEEGQTTETEKVSEEPPEPARKEGNIFTRLFRR